MGDPSQSEPPQLAKYPPTLIDRVVSANALKRKSRELDGSEPLIRRVAEEVAVALEHRSQLCYSEQFLQALVHLDQF